MSRKGYADLPLHHGRVPPWLSERMKKVGGAVIEAMVWEYGKSRVLQRMSDPFWFQSLGCVMGMDWHSSGVTTSVIGALKRALNPIAGELGLYICGGRGKHSRSTPKELLQVADQTGLNGDELVRCSKLSAKVDNTAVQDGFQLYLHAFIVSDEGEWTVVQQGMRDVSGMARRYHWHSALLKDFLEEPHAFVCGEQQGQILNLTDKAASPTKQAVLDLTREKPQHLLPEFRRLRMPAHHDVRAGNVDLKRLGGLLSLIHDYQPENMEKLLLLKGVGPRTLQSLTLISEVIHGTPSRFSDPARFSLAHGGKDGHPFPVPTKVYDETISVLRSAVDKAKVDHSDKQQAIRSLSEMSRKLEKGFHPRQGGFKAFLQKERQHAHGYGGRTVKGWSRPPEQSNNGQLNLF